MKVLYFTIVFQCLILFCFSQEGPSTVDKIVEFPTQFLDKLNKKASFLESKVLGYSEKTLHRLEKQERKILKKLYKKDSVAAKELLKSSQEDYIKLQEKLTSGVASLQRGKEYLGHFDTLNTSLKFLTKNADNLIINQTALQGKLKSVTKSMAGLNDKLQGAETIQKYIKNRKQLLSDQLQKAGLVKEIKKYNQYAYYYAAQIKEYKNILEDPTKIEQKAIGLLKKIPMFEQFIRQNSELAALFPEPANYGTLQGLAGLQTRSNIQSLIKSQFENGGPNAQDLIKQNLQQAQGIISQLNDKVNKIGGASSSNFDLPEGFTPNDQKTKTIWKRLEYGTNIQNTWATSFWPNTTDLGISVGYKLNDKAIVGIGSSIKIGWGQNIQNVRFTAEGFSIRSYIDFKLKGSFFISGGYEQNYRSRFTNIRQLRNQPDQWFRSGLLGLSKTLSIKSKLFKTTKAQIMYDFLWKEQVPNTQPFLFRTGFIF